MPEAGPVRPTRPPQRARGSTSLCAHAMRGALLLAALPGPRGVPWVRRPATSVPAVAHRSRPPPRLPPLCARGAGRPSATAWVRCARRTPTTTHRVSMRVAVAFCTGTTCRARCPAWTTAGATTEAAPPRATTRSPRAASTRATLATSKLPKVTQVSTAPWAPRGVGGAQTCPRCVRRQAVAWARARAPQPHPSSCFTHRPGVTAPMR